MLVKHFLSKNDKNFSFALKSPQIGQKKAATTHNRSGPNSSCKEGDPHCAGTDMGPNDAADGGGVVRIKRIYTFWKKMK